HRWAGRSPLPADRASRVGEARRQDLCRYQGVFVSTLTTPNQMMFGERSFRGAEGLCLRGEAGGAATAPAVVLMHGGGQTRHSWASAMSELVSQDFFALSYDARGHGDSDWSPEGHYSLQGMAADLQAVLATLPSKPALVGASMGGATALYAVGN